MARSGHGAPGRGWVLVSILAVLLLSGCGVPEEFQTPTPTPTPEQSPTPTATSEPTPTATFAPPSSTNTPPLFPTTTATPPFDATETTVSLRATPTHPPTATTGPTPPPSTSQQIAQVTTTALPPGPGPAATVLVVNPEATTTASIATIVATIVPTATATPELIATPEPTPEPTTEPEPTATPDLCPGALPWYEAINNIGSYTTVIGPVVAAYWAEEARGKPTFLNVGAPYPDPSRFTVLMWIDARWNFDFPPEETYLGSTICVSGTIALYEGSAEMIIEGPEWIWIP